MDVMMAEIEANMERIKKKNEAYDRAKISSEPAISPSRSAIQRPTFASILSKSKDLSQLTTDLPSPIQRGDAKIIKIDSKLHSQELSLCRTNLIGKILLRPGSKPMKLDELQSLLKKSWKPESLWQMTPLAHLNKEIVDRDLEKIPIMETNRSELLAAEKIETGTKTSTDALVNSNKEISSVDKAEEKFNDPVVGRVSGDIVEIELNNKNTTVNLTVDLTNFDNTGNPTLEVSKIDRDLATLSNHLLKKGAGTT
ncbi:DUF4283 domain protein [Melia azedarach]|uniref:DUF4283 domain protein n=1 Tax=Melia azedarach TaxID=155640 RepID=A0ACC1Y6K0_MELAZ|nr:DUF4283 domain protein [Melia azedarach]